MEKYLIEIKNITGNSLNDDRLSKLASKEKNDFVKEMTDLFSEKQKYRINILGEDQNRKLEKKIILKIIDIT